MIYSLHKRNIVNISESKVVVFFLRVLISDIFLMATILSVQEENMNRIALHHFKHLSPIYK